MPTVLIHRTLPASRIELSWNDQPLVFRPFRPEDAVEFLSVVEDSREALQCYLPWVPRVQDLEGAAGFLQRTMVRYWEGTSFDLGLFDHEHRLLASAGLDATSPNPDCFDLSYWVAEAHEGQGFASLSAQLCELYAFEYLNALRVQLTHDTDNTPSGRLAKRLGFVFEGTMRNITAIADSERPHGYEGTGDGKLYALLPSDRPRLAWYEPLRASARFISAAGL